jgi:hypothetical protein
VKTLPRSIKFTLTSALLLLPALPVSAQTLKVTSLTQAAGNQLSITVQNTGTATTFELQGSPTMAAGIPWTPLSATFAPISGQSGFFRATITRPAAPRYFLRVLGLSGSADDTDGDGLSNVFETTALPNGNGTNPNLADTDGDGFHDGREFAAGTDPKNAQSFPPFANLPIVRFANATTTVTEGDGVIPLALQTGNGSFSGTVSVEVSTNGNAVAGTDFTVPATVTMTNGTATLPLTLIDNLTLSQNYRILILQVKSAAGYTIGGGFRTTVVIGDNDAYWSGSLDDGNLQQNFRLRMLRQGATSQIAFVSGSANDGLPQSAQTGTTDQSAGIIPAGVHATTVTANSATLFDITSPALPAGGQATMFGSSLVLNRTLRLRAGTGITPSSVTAARIYGTFTENTTAPGGTAPHLAINRSGTFALVRDIPSTPTLTAVAP